MPTPGNNTFGQGPPTRVLTIMTIMLIRGTRTDTDSIQVCISVIPDSTDRGFEADTGEVSVKGVEDSAANSRLRTLTRVRSLRPVGVTGLQPSQNRCVAHSSARRQRDDVPMQEWPPCFPARFPLR
jgi:hypothetical protein